MAQKIQLRKRRLNLPESWSFSKNPFEKMRFQAQKYEKYLKSKNDLKMPLGPFNKKL